VAPYCGNCELGRRRRVVARETHSGQV
jgi:hypothetical protein